MAVLMLMATQEPGRLSEWLVALLLAWFAGLVILLLADRLRPLLGPRGLLATERLMGMILLVVSVQLFLTGVDAFLRHVNVGSI